MENRRDGNELSLRRSRRCNHGCCLGDMGKIFFTGPSATATISGQMNEIGPIFNHLENFSVREYSKVKTGHTQSELIDNINLYDGAALRLIRRC
ncbi:hypothetical protein JTB14_031509 [Gonioctena quinquepunctata]|nr:hypothetical protein JTB14_031509 [Gonioctena quinquepunctata]